MKLHNYIRLAVVALLLILAVGVGYYLGNRSDVMNDNALQQELEQMRSEAEQAAVVKRVSQQMEEIAYQQKALSDSAAHEALQQSALARENARKAEEESQRARQAQHEAMLERQHAEREAQMAMAAEREAIMMRDEAQQQRQKSDHLMYLTIARTLSDLAVTNFDDHNREVGRILTLQAYRMFSEAGGNLYSDAMYRAMAESLGLLQSYSFPTHSYVIDIDFLPPPAVGAVAVSSYGEVMLFTLRKGQHRAEQKLLFADKSIYFKSCVPCQDYIVLMDQTGALYTMTYDGHLSEKWQSITDTKVEYVYRLKGNILLVNGTDRLVWVNSKNHKRMLEYKCPNPLECITVRNDANGDPASIYLFLEGGLCHVVSPVGKLISEMQMPFDAPCQEAVVTEDGEIFAGLENGKVYHTLVGLKSNLLTTHISTINGIRQQDSICVTLSKDHKICFRDMRQLVIGKSQEWVEPATYTVTGWPWAVAMCCSPDFPMNILWISCTNGEVLQMPMLMSEMGKALENAGIRNMTRAEWSRYVGNNLKYPY